MSIEFGHTWGYNNGLIRAALNYQDLSTMRGTVTVDLGNGDMAMSAGQSEFKVYGVLAEYANTLGTTALGDRLSYRIGGGVKRAERDDTSVTTLNRNGVELQRTENAESDRDTALFVRLGVDYRLSPKDSLGFTLDVSGGFFQSDSSMTSLTAGYSRKF